MAVTSERAAFAAHFQGYFRHTLGATMCRIKSERQMSALIPPFVGNPECLWQLPVCEYLARTPASQGATEDIEMFARKGVFSSIGRTAALATVAAVALTAFEPSLARAGSAPAGKGLSTSAATSDATDFSARRRYHRHYGGGGAAAAAFAGIVGTGIAIAATQNRRAYYDDYYGGPGYYGGGPYYRGGYGYGGGPYYRGW
jgi:hypothetical protein